jgi:hypothetical protein
MQNQLFEYWTTSGSAFSESMRALTDINTKTLRKVGEQQQALAHTFMEAWNRQIQLATDVKGYPDLLSAQTKLATEQWNKYFAIARDTASVFEAGKVEFTVWVAKNVQPANQPVSDGSSAKPVSAVPSARKAA